MTELTKNDFWRRCRCGWRRYYATVVAAILGGGLLFYAGFIEPVRMVFKPYEIAISTLPPQFDGLKIAVLSDLHATPSLLKRLPEYQARLEQWRPDLILLPGDFIDGTYGQNLPVTLEELTAGLRDFRAPLGVYAVLGNHDLCNGAARMCAALNAANIRVLRDEAVTLRKEGAELNLIGVNFYIDGYGTVGELVKTLTRGGTNLVLAHTPDIFPELPDGCALTIAGHTHGGQLRLPFYGSLLVPSRFGTRYDYGLITEKGRRLLVTGGIGTGRVGLRFGMPPEILLVTLRAHPSGR